MSLENFVDYKEEIPEKVLLVDTNNLSMRCLFAIKYDPTDIGFVDYKQAFLTTLRSYINRLRPDKIIFCQEGYDNWRRDYFPDYKQHREKDRKASYVNFDEFFKMNNVFMETLEEIFKNALFLRINKLEADDLIALITRYKKSWDITIVSTDRDFHQLYKYPNFKQFNPTKKQFVEVLSPEIDLLVKIVIGDKDEAPQLKAKVGLKTAERIIRNGELEQWLKKHNLQEKFDRNRILISFDQIPEKYHQRVVDAVDKWKQGTFDGRKFYDLVMKDGLGGTFENINDFCVDFSSVGLGCKQKEC